MDIKKEIEKYKTSSDQEVKDKELILKYLNEKDVFTRDNELVHFTASAFVINKDRNKLLMIHHNIFNSWGYIGGHADGDKDLFNVAKKEIEEETGVKKIKPIIDEIFLIELLPIKGHVRKGKYVASHIHISIEYLFEADEKEKLVINEDENSDVRWIPFDEVVVSSTEPHMQVIYQKAIDKIKSI